MDLSFDEYRFSKKPKILDLARKQSTALGPGSEGNELGLLSPCSSGLTAPPFWIFVSVPVPHALRAPLALCSPLISSLDGSDGLRRSFPTKMERAVSHRDVDSFSAWGIASRLCPFIFRPARVVPTTDGEHLSIRSRAVTGSPITPKANFNSPNLGSSRVVIVDSYKDMESTVDVSDSTLSFVACIPIRVATDSVSYVSGRKTAFGLPTLLMATFRPPNDL